MRCWMQFELPCVFPDMAFDAPTNKNAIPLNDKAHNVNTKPFNREYLFVLFDCKLHFICQDVKLILKFVELVFRIAECDNIIVVPIITKPHVFSQSVNRIKKEVRKNRRN